MLDKQFLKGEGAINQTIGIKVQNRCFHPGHRLPLPAGLRLPGGEAGGAGLGRVVPGGKVLTLARGLQASPRV